MPRKRSYSDDDLRKAVAESRSFLEVASRLGLSNGGDSQKSLKRYIQEIGLDTSHFTGQAYLKGQPSPHRRENMDDILVRGSNYQAFKLKNLLFRNGLKRKECERCGRSSWLLHPIPLELHHKDGDKTNNLIENLEILCPNCHAQTELYRGRAKRS